MIKLGWTALICTSMFLATEAAEAQDTESCRVAEPLDATRFLRRLSLDIRGESPSYAEMLEQRGADVLESTIEAYLQSPEFVRTMRSTHAEVLWPNIDQVEIIPDTHVLYPYEIVPGQVIWMSFLRAVFIRPAPGGDLYYPCKNEPATFDLDGKLVVEPVMIGNSVIAYQEGWVEVEPYWAPGTTIKVCGFDAQGVTRAAVCPGPVERYPFAQPFCDNVQAVADSVNTPFRGTQIDCASPLSIFAPECGCGANLELCHTTETLATLRNALLEQELRIVDRVITSGAPYHEILRTKDSEMNGPIAHYLRHQSRLTLDLYGDPDATAPIPEDLIFTDTALWKPVARSGRHAGVLTTPGYLLRFQSNRARAHRFYNAFECATFIPNGPLPSPFEECSKHEDLTKRCGCDACHRSLEPMAAHWGRFAEYGFTPIDDVLYPRVAGAACRAPFENVERLLRCVRFYEVDPIGEEVPYYGMLNAYVFRTADEVPAIEDGPLRLADASIASGRFASCTARRMWTQFMRRPPTSEEEQTTIPTLVARYEESGQDLRALVKAIVTDPAYRRAP